MVDSQELCGAVYHAQELDSIESTGQSCNASDLIFNHGFVPVICLLK
jgi:hypothetical protein